MEEETLETRRVLLRSNLRKALLEQGFARTSYTPVNEHGAYNETWKHITLGKVILEWAPRD